MNAHNFEKATFAGGCFWCLESIFAETPGIVSTEVWYAGWEEINPTYEQVCAGCTGHREAIQVEFDPSQISYKELLILFWSQIDPTDSSGQFADRGFSYTTAIWYHSLAQKELALDSKDQIEESKKIYAQVATEILAFSTFYSAEEYHQKYYQKSRLRYQLYRKGSGRENFVDTIGQELFDYLRGKDASFAKKYKKLPESELRNKLDKLSYAVTQENVTEHPFTSEFIEKWKDGIYIDIVSGEPLFASVDQYDAGCGWPSFSCPINSHFIVNKPDEKYGMHRTEVRSKYGDSHLGHVFDDGPGGRKRYCINGAALIFISKEELIKKGYSEYNFLFDEKITPQKE